MWHYCKILLISCCTLLSAQLFAQGNVCGHPVTDSDATIVLPQDAGITLDGNPVPSGSILQLSYRRGDGLICAWQVTWTEQNTFFTAHGRDETNDGFTTGEAYLFSLSLPSGCVVTASDVEYRTGGLFNGDGTFRRDQISGLNTLTFSTDISVRQTVNLPDTCGASVGRLAISVAGENDPYTFDWSNEGDSSALAGLNAGEYAVTITDRNGCQTDTTFLVDQVDRQPPVELGGPEAAICPGDSLRLATTFPAVSYQWFFDETPLPGGINSSISVRQSGSYRLRVTDRYGCENADEVRVNELSIPEVDLGGDTTLCPEVELRLSATCPNCRYAWSDESEQREILAGEGMFSVTVTNADGCSATDSIEIDRLESPEFTLGQPDTFCAGETFLLRGPTDQEYEYQWSTGAISRSIEVNTSGNYALLLRDVAGCTARDTLSLTFLQEVDLRIDADATTVCPGDSVLLTVTGAPDYLWIDGRTALSDPFGGRTYAFPSQVDTFFRVVGQNDCFVDTAEVALFAFPTAASAGPDTCITQGSTIQLQAGGGALYTWAKNDFPVSRRDVPDPEVSPSDATFYVVEIVDFNNCVLTDSVFIEVINANPRGVIFTPNFITPNGDDINDALELSKLEKFPRNKITVHNRWGDIVYSTSDYQNDWRGTHKGKALPAGAYYYTLEINGFILKQALRIAYE